MNSEELWYHPKLLELDWKEMAIASYALQAGDGWKQKAETIFGISWHQVVSCEYILNDILGIGWDRPTGEDPESKIWFEKSMSEYPKTQPGSSQSVPLSSPKAKAWERWQHWVKQKHVKPQVMFLAVWCYTNKCQKGGHYIKALMNFLSPSAKIVPEYLPWALEEYKRQQEKI